MVPLKRALHTPNPSPIKRLKTSPLRQISPSASEWPAPQSAMQDARHFILDIVRNKYKTLIVPDKDADGLSAGTLLYKCLVMLGLPADRIGVHHLTKGHNVHSDHERALMTALGPQRVVVLDQGSRPGRELVERRSDMPEGPSTLIIDHHMSTEWPEDALVLTACHTPPIATASLLTYMLLRDLHPDFHRLQGWRAVVGVYGDLGPNTAKWGQPPWPSDLGDTVKACGSKVLSDAVSAVNAPRRTADYNVPKAWQIMLDADHPRQVASNAFLKLCRLDASAETEKWARTAPRFSADGRVAVITVHSGFQIHPVIATRWAGTLGRKSSKLIMIMCANHAYNPDSSLVSFSCRLSAPLRKLPDDTRPNLIALLNEYAEAMPGFRERVGNDYARGHKEATGGIIPKNEFAPLLDAMGVNDSQTTKSKTTTGKSSSSAKATGTREITHFFQAKQPSTRKG